MGLAGDDPASENYKEHLHQGLLASHPLSGVGEAWKRYQKTAAKDVGSK
jgi:hypothetical protein